MAAFLEKAELQHSCGVPTANNLPRRLNHTLTSASVAGRPSQSAAWPASPVGLAHYSSSRTNSAHLGRSGKECRDQTVHNFLSVYYTDKKII